MVTVAHSLRKALERVGIAIDRTERQTAARRGLFMKQEGITLAIDVGAHVGGYSAELRRNDFTGRIESFEPNPSSFNELQARTSGDPVWRAHQVGLGDAAREMELNIAGNQVSSSFLKIHPAHIDAAPESRYVGSQLIEVKRLDDLQLVAPGDFVLLKIDTQGFERQVLAGAPRTLEQTRLVEMEMSIVPLYEGQMMLLEALVLMGELGFSLIWLERGFIDAQMRLLQVDGIFARQALAGSANPHDDTLTPFS